MNRTALSTRSCIPKTPDCNGKSAARRYPLPIFYALNFLKLRSTKNHQKTLYRKLQLQVKRGNHVPLRGKVWLGQHWQDTEAS